MTIHTQSCSPRVQQDISFPICFQEGLPGFSTFKQGRLQFDASSYPFGVLSETAHTPVEFLITQPAFFFKDYTFTLADHDVDSLQINHQDDLLVFNVVTVHPDDPMSITVNLLAPIVVNQKNGYAKQVIIEDDVAYSTHTPLRLNPTAA